MAGIFLSYSRADRPRAQVFAEALQAEGFTVWWDKVLRAGQTYDEVTEQMLRDSSVVVVLWSTTSVKSKWVRAEATLGQRDAHLMPAMIEEADRPIMFELTQTADLIGWEGDRTDEHWKGFVADIRRFIEADEAAPAQKGAPALDATIENTFWNSVKDSSDPSELEAYIERYPKGHFTGLAKSRLAALSVPSGSRVDAAAPKPAPAAAPAVPKEKKSGSKAPLLIGALVLLAAVGGGGVYFTQGGLPGGLSIVEPVEPDCEACPEMVAVPSGTFLIGSPESERNRSGNEGPQAELSIAAFEMSKSEITRGQWALCVADNGCREIAGGDDNQPITSVSWDDAQAYARWLSGKSGKPHRLPTEAEWEFAARGGTSTAYWWGDQFERGRVVSGEAADVTTLTENPFGLQGMLGNVREWVEDCYLNVAHTQRASDGSAFLSGNCERRVVRGASFRQGAPQHRAANRARIGKGTVDSTLGFRVASSASDD